MILDARGLRCPEPVIRLARLARETPDGTVVTVRATDVAAPGDIAAWCRMRGHQFLGSDDDAAEPGVSVTEVRLGAPVAPGTPPAPAG